MMQRKVRLRWSYPAQSIMQQRVKLLVDAVKASCSAYLPGILTKLLCRRWLGMAGYAGFAALGAGCIPTLYPALKWYMVLAAFGVAPVFSVANAYGAGVTDWDQVCRSDRSL